MDTTRDLSKIPISQYTDQELKSCIHLLADHFGDLKEEMLSIKRRIIELNVELSNRRNN